MTKQEVLDILRLLDRDQQIKWLIDIGMALTISARAGYPHQENPGNLSLLIAFNEMQHQIYSRIFHLHANDEWPIEAFLDVLQQCSVHYGVEGDFGGALKSSLMQRSSDV